MDIWDTIAEGRGLFAADAVRAVGTREFAEEDIKVTQVHKQSQGTTLGKS